MEIFDYDNILLLPRKCRVESRSECDASVQLGSRTFRLPVVPANMKTVVDESICEWMAKNGYFYVMHRFDIDNVKLVRDMHAKGVYASISLGVKAPDRATVDRRLELVPDRVEQEVVTRSQQDAGLAGLCDEASGVRGPVAHRLLEQQVDAGREKRLGHGEVGVGRGEHVRRIGPERHHLVDAPDDRLDPWTGCERFGHRRVDIAPDDGVGAGFPDRLIVQIRDVTEADECDTHVCEPYRAARLQIFGPESAGGAASSATDGSADDASAPRPRIDRTADMPMSNRSGAVNRSAAR